MTLTATTSRSEESLNQPDQISGASDSQRVIAISGLLTVGMALTGLLGWLTNTYWLRTLGSEGNSMKVNTALMLLLTGIELLRIRWYSTRPGFFCPARC